MSSKPLAELVKELPPGAQQEVRDFVEFLLSKQRQKGNDRLRQTWAGALREHREHFTALELQRKALEWRND